MQRQTSKPIDPAATVTRHWFKVAVFGSALFIVIFPVLLLVKSPYYSAVGKLRISPVVPALISRSEELSITGYYTSYVQTQVDKIKTSEILEAAVADLPPDIRRIMAPGDMPLQRAAEILRRRMIVIQVAGTHLISITLGGTRPEGLAETINAVLGAYMERLREEEEGRDNRRLMYLKKDRDARKQEVERLTGELKELSRDAHTSTFSEMHNVHEPALVSLQHAYVSAYQKRVEKENALAELRAGIERESAISLDPMVAEMVEANDALHQIDFYTYQMLQQMRSSIDGVSKSNPDKKYIDARMSGMQDYLEKMRDSIRQRSHSVIYGKRDVEQQQRIIRAEAECRQAEQEELDIVAERDRVQQLRAETSQAIMKGQEIEATLEHLRSMLNRIDERINDLKLETMAPGRVTLESAARRPEVPDGEQSKKGLLLALLLSYGAAAALCIGFDILDRRVRTRKDVAAAVGAPPTWPVSDYSRHARPGTGFHRITRDDPRSTAAMAINSLAVHLDKERLDHGGKVAVFTGVDGCSGVTGIAINTAYALSKVCGKTLVIDANRLSPGVALLCGSAAPVSGNSPEGSAWFASLITPDAGPGYDLLDLTAESIPGFEKSALPGMLRELRGRYGYIVIDAPPVLRHDMTEYLLVHADVAALVIQGDRSLYGATHMAADIIFKLQVPALAPVLNWGAPRLRSQGERAVAELLRRVEEGLRGLPALLASAADRIAQFRIRRSS